MISEAVCVIITGDLESEGDLQETTAPSASSAIKQESKVNTQVCTSQQQKNNNSLFRKMMLFSLSVIGVNLVPQKKLTKDTLKCLSVSLNNSVSVLFTVLQMTAVITKSGDLKIISGPEDSSDAEGKLNSS